MLTEFLAEKGVDRKNITRIVMRRDKTKITDSDQDLARVYVTVKGGKAHYLGNIEVQARYLDIKEKPAEKEVAYSI
mgnify:CR=1 FL=1